MSIEKTRVQILEQIVGAPRTPAEIAAVLGMREDAVTACLRGLFNHRQVVRFKPATLGQPYRYRAREANA